MERRALLLLIATLLIAACGRSAGTRAVTRTTPTPAPASAPTGTAVNAQVRPSAVPRSATPPARPGESPAPTPRYDYPNLKPGEQRKIWGDMPIEVEVAPVCATVGTAMRAVVRTEKGASVGGAVRYHDQDPHGDIFWGPRIETEEYRWAWTIKPGTPVGKADLLVTAGKPSQEGQAQRGGAAMATFRVAKEC